MTKPSRLPGNRSYLVLVLIMLALVLPLTVVLAATAAPLPASKPSGLSLPTDKLDATILFAACGIGVPPVARLD